MSATERLDQIEWRMNDLILRDGDVPALIAALRAVLKVCDDPAPGGSDCEGAVVYADDVLDAIASALGVEP